MVTELLVGLWGSVDVDQCSVESVMQAGEQARGWQGGRVVVVVGVAVLVVVVAVRGPVVPVLVPVVAGAVVIAVRVAVAVRVTVRVTAAARVVGVGGAAGSVRGGRAVATA